MRSVLIAVFVSLCSVLDAQIEVAVHRGANRHCPENTMSAGKVAAELGGDFLEIDVRENLEGIFFNFHDKSLDRTTDGNGLFFDRTMEEIKDLDAGSWFRYEFADEKIPTVEEMVLALKGQIKFYFDFKEGDLRKFVGLIKEWGVSDDCFFTLSHTDIPILQQAGIAFKVNISNLEELISADEKWSPPIVEVRAHNLSKELVEAAHSRGIKVMPYVPGDQVDLYAHCLNFDIDMINLDNPDLFRSLERKKEIPLKFVAHRGGVVEGDVTEYSPEGIKLLNDREYYGTEIDIWETSDGALVVHHNRNLQAVFGVDVEVANSTLEELKSHVSILGDYQVLTLSEYLDLLPAAFVIMPDIKTKGQDRSPDFYESLKRDISKRHDFSKCIFIDDNAREYYWGEARFGVRVAELPDLFERWKRGGDVASNYFLFDHGNRLSAEAVRLAQMMSIEVVPSVNTFHYRMENSLLSGLRDIANLKRLGVRVFQIDSVYDSFRD